MEATQEILPGPFPALDVCGLSKQYGDIFAVRELDLSVPPGEILGLVGPNGAGKTTTLLSIAGILPIREGAIRIGGFDVERDPMSARSLLAWVPDDPQPFDSLTVWEQLKFTAAMFGVEPWESRAEELLERFDLMPKREALGGELSRGMRQKLAFACAWLSNPKLVLLDEPLSGLDPRGIRSAKQAIREQADAGTALVISSHLLELIEVLADRILILDRGQTVFLGRLEDARRTLAHGDQSSLEEIFLSVTERELDPEPEPEPEPDPGPGPGPAQATE